MFQSDLWDNYVFYACTHEVDQVLALVAELCLCVFMLCTGEHKQSGVEGCGLGEALTYTGDKSYEAALCVRHAYYCICQYG
jgi:hypothetical protein